MIFSRGKAKSFDYTSTLRQVEADTIKRWRSIAAGGSEPERSEPESCRTTGFSLGVEATAPTEATRPDIQSFVVRSGGAVERPAISLIDEMVLPDSPGDVHETGSWSRGEQRSFLTGFQHEPYEADEELPRCPSDEYLHQHDVPELDYETAEPEPEYSCREEVEMSQPEVEEEPVLPPVRKILPCDLTLPAEEDLRRRFGTNIRSALGPGTVIEGTFSFDAPVCIDGTLNGEVRSSSALIVGAHATVNATIVVGSLIVLGKVTGPVQAQDLIEIRAGGVLEGDVYTTRLVVEDGGAYNGRCHQMV